MQRNSLRRHLSPLGEVVDVNSIFLVGILAQASPILPGQFRRTNKRCSLESSRLDEFNDVKLSFLAHKKKKSSKATNPYMSPDQFATYVSWPRYMFYYSGFRV